MPTKKRPHSGRDPISEEYIPVPILEESDEDIDRVAAKLGSDGLEFKIYHMENGAWSLCHKQNDADIDEDALREKWGAGRYRVRIFKNDELVHVGYFALAKPVNNPETGGGGSGATDQIKLMFEMFRQQNENLVRIIEAQTAGGRNEAPSMAEIADTLVKLKSLDGGGNAMGAEKVIELIKTGMDIAKESGPREPESFGSQLLSTVKEALPMLMAGAKPLQPQLTAGEPSEEEKVRARELMLRQGIEFLKQKALNGSDPDLYVGMVLDNVDNPLYRGLMEWVLQTEWEQIIVFDAEIGKPPNAEFFRAVYDGLRSEGGGPDSLATDTGGPGGHLPNTPNNANGSPRGPKKSASR